MEADDERAAPAPINFFDDGTSDGESALLQSAVRPAESQLKHESLNSATISADSNHDPSKRYPPQRPLRPSERNSGTSQQHDKIFPEILEVTQARLNDWVANSSPQMGIGARGSKSRPISISPETSSTILNTYTATLDAILKPGPDQNNKGAAESSEAYEPASTTLNKDSDFPNPSTDPTKRRTLSFPAAIIVEPSSKTYNPDIRTPFPFNIRKSFIRQSHISATSPTPQEAILALALRRRNNGQAWQVSELRIPASPDIVPVISQKGKENSSEAHFDTLDFDDAHFFAQLRLAYARFTGPFRFFSARGLQHIHVLHSELYDSSNELPCCNSSHSSCQHNLSRSPLRVVSQGLSDSFSESNLMAFYHCPRLGKASYMWVHWAHRIACTPAHLLPPAPIPPAAITSTHSSPAVPTSRPASPPKVALAENKSVAGLEFVRGWVRWRIGLAVILVLLLTVAAVVIWTVVGVDQADGLLVGNGDVSRLVPAFLLGVVVFAVGFATVGLWAGLSWLID
jgi:hypothetical protein